MTGKDKINVNVLNVLCITSIIFRMMLTYPHYARLFGRKIGYISHIGAQQRQQRNHRQSP